MLSRTSSNFVPIRTHIFPNLVFDAYYYMWGGADCELTVMFNHNQRAVISGKETRFNEYCVVTHQDQGQQQVGKAVLPTRYVNMQFADEGARRCALFAIMQTRYSLGPA